MALPLPAQDADLVVLARRGREDAFGALYERYFPGVYDFLTRLLRDRQEAADVTQDTFIKAFERLAHLQKPESFKSWLFTIAHRNGLNRIERSKRAVAVGDFYVTDREAGELGVIDPDRAGDPERSAEARAAATIIWEAAAGLDPRTYSVMDLHVRQGLESAEIAEVLGVSKGNAYTMVSRMKKQFSEALSTYLLVRKGAQDCPELATIVAPEAGGGLTPELRKAADRHAKTCDVCNDNREALFVPLKIFAALAAAPVPAGLKAAIWGTVQTAAIGAGTVAAGKGAPAAVASDAPPQPQPAASGGGGVTAAARRITSNLAGIAAAAVLIALLFVGGAALLNDRAEAPTEVLSGSVSGDSSNGGSDTSATPTDSGATASTTPATTQPPATTEVPATTAVSTTVGAASTSTTTLPPTTSVPPPTSTTTAPIPPLVVRADSAQLAEDTSVVIAVLDNDSNVAPGAAPVVATAPNRGSATVSGRAVVYTPNSNYSGTDQFAYSVRGSDGSTKTAQVSVDVTPVNDAPDVPGPGDLFIEEDGSVTFDPLAEAFDVDGDSIELIRFDATSQNGGTITAGSLVYTPLPNWSGTDTFSYTVGDGTVEVVVSVSIAVAAVNDLPSGPAPVIDAVEDESTSANLLSGWSDVEGDRVFIANPGNRTTAAGGTAAVGTSGATTYQPPADFSGTDQFFVRISDGTDSLRVKVVVNVAAANDPPEASNQSFTISESAAVGFVVGRVTASDPDGDDFSFEPQGSSSFTVEADGDVVIVLPLDFEASTQHQLTVIVRDENGATDSFVVTLVVTDVDEAPQVSSASWFVAAGAPAGTVVGSISAADPEGRSITYGLTGARGLLAVDSATGVVRLAVAADPADFPISATATATDPAGNQGSAAISVSLSDIDGPAVQGFESDVDAFFAPAPGGGACGFEPNRVVFTARVTDPSGISTVDLHWRLTAFTGAVRMTDIGGGTFRAEFTAPPGLVETDPETLFTRIIARDSLGNTTETPEISVVVNPCDED